LQDARAESLAAQSSEFREQRPAKKPVDTNGKSNKVPTFAMRLLNEIFKIGQSVDWEDSPKRPHRFGFLLPT
jgi:hypothetical protein